MNKILITFFTVIFCMTSSLGYSQTWEFLNKSSNGDIYYIDADRIRNIDGYILYWALIDFKIKDDYGDFSEINYTKLDCKNFRYMYLSRTFYSLPNGKGKSTEDGTVNKWVYIKPNTKGERMIDYFCNG